jgi:hypothetical protein
MFHIFLSLNICCNVLSSIAFRANAEYSRKEVRKAISKQKLMLSLKEFTLEVSTEEGKCISIYHYHNAGYYYVAFFSQKSFKYLVQIRSKVCLWGMCGGK